MDKKDIVKLMKLIYKIDNLGHSNIMVRNAMDTIDRELKLYNKKNWRNYISEHIEIIEKAFQYQLDKENNQAVLNAEDPNYRIEKKS